MIHLLILMGTGVVIVVGGILAGLYSLDGDGITDLTSDIVVTKRIETDDGTTAFVTPPANPADALHVRLQPISVPIVDDQRVIGGAKLIVTVELIDGTSSGDLDDAMPRLLAGIFEDFYRTPPARDIDTGKLDVTAIERRIEAIAIKTGGVDANNRNIVRSAQLLKVIKQGS